MSRFIYFFVFLSVFFACSSETDRIQNEKNALVEVKGSVLNKQEVLNTMPKGLSVSDSVQFVDNFVKTWIGTELLYDQALRNVPNLPEIEKLAEQYRKQLIIFEYQKQLITERLEQQISETEMENFYEMYADKFKLNSAIIKGLFLKVPEDAPQIEDVKKWCRTTDAQSIENIEKYSLKNAIIYEYFMDKWVSFSDVMDNIPYTITDETTGQVTEFVYDNTDDSWSVEANGISTKFMTFTDENHVDMYLPGGETMNVEISQAGVLAFKNLVENSAYYASK